MLPVQITYIPKMKVIIVAAIITAFAGATNASISRTSTNCEVLQGINGAVEKCGIAGKCNLFLFGNLGNTQVCILGFFFRETDFLGD